MANDKPMRPTIEWFLEARVGMFVHWGLYSVLGRGEQIMWRDLMPLKEYEGYAADFRPAPAWAKKLAEKAADNGMWTCRGRTANITLFTYPGETPPVSKIGPDIRSAEWLGTGQKLKIEKDVNGRTLIRGLPDTPPDVLAPVVKVEFEAPPYAITDFPADWLTGSFRSKT